MNRNVVGAILIVLALALIYFFAWPKLKPYVSTPAPGPATETTGTVAI
jgi:hypothetical protein